MLTLPMTTSISHGRHLDTELIIHTMQSECAPATESTNPGTSVGKVTAGCRVCGKSPDQVQFSNSQRKRLKKGKIATCKNCASPADSGGSTAPSASSVGARVSSVGATAITETESLTVPMASTQVMQ